MRLPAKRLYRVEYYVIGRNGGHIGKNVVAVDAYNRDDAMSVVRRMGYTPIKIV